MRYHATHTLQQKGSIMIRKRIPFSSDHQAKAYSVTFLRLQHTNGHTIALHTITTRC